MLNEFREFAMKGNVLDWRGIISSGRSGPYVRSLVADRLPPIGLALA